MNVSLVEAGVETPFDEPEYRRAFEDIAPQNVDVLLAITTAVDKQPAAA